LVSDGSTAHAFAYDGDQIVAEYQNGSLAAGYTLGTAADQPLDMNRGGNVFYYLQDQHQNVTALLNGSGAVAQTYSYSAYGVPGSGSTAVANPLTYAAMPYDARAGAYYSRARYYDPTNGVFLSQDPQLALNPYGYANGDPIDFSDPTGLQNILTLGGILKWDLDIGRRVLGCALGLVGVAVGLAYRTLTSGQQNPWVTGANAAFACAYGAFFPGFGKGGFWGKVGYVAFTSVVGYIYGFIVDVIDQLLKCGLHTPDFGQAGKTGLYTGAAGGAGGVISVGSAGKEGIGAVAGPTLSTAAKAVIRSGSPPVTC
jgi:RHS repeat-associated protein